MKRPRRRRIVERRFSRTCVECVLTCGHTRRYRYWDEPKAGSCVVCHGCV